MMYETILSPIHYGGMQLKNRIIFAPTTFGLSDEEYLAKIRAIAQGGCAMIIVGDVPVGKSKFEKSLFDTKGFAFYQEVVKIAHDADCKVCAQLHQSDSNLLAMFKYIPGLLLKKITPDQLREKLNQEKDERLRAVYAAESLLTLQRCPNGRSGPSSAGLEKRRCWQNRPVLI